MTDGVQVTRLSGQAEQGSQGFGWEVREETEMWPGAGSEAEAPHCANRPLEEARSRSARDKQGAGNHSQQVKVHYWNRKAENNSRHTGQRREAASQGRAILVVFLLNVATRPHQVPALLPPSRALKTAEARVLPRLRRAGAQLRPRSMLRLGTRPWGSCDGPALPSPAPVPVSS